MSDSPNTFPVTLPGDGTTPVAPEPTPTPAPEPVATPVAASAPFTINPPATNTVTTNTANGMRPAQASGTPVFTPPAQPTFSDLLKDAAPVVKAGTYTVIGTTASMTPNVVIGNPIVRKTVNLILSIASVLVTLAYIVDAALQQVDWTQYTTPAAAILIGVAGVFNLTVTVPNTPKS